jgi:F-type H+-transporting ATPase subunit gamma
VITGDRGLAGAYNSNIIRFTQYKFDKHRVPVKYIAVGRKGRDLLIRRKQNVIADFSNLPAAPSFVDVSAIGRLAVDEFLAGEVDEVNLVYTDFINMGRQKPP